MTGHRYGLLLENVITLRYGRASTRRPWRRSWGSWSVWHDASRSGREGLSGGGGHRFTQGDQRVVDTGAAANGTGPVRGRVFRIQQPRAAPSVSARDRTHCGPNTKP